MLGESDIYDSYNTVVDDRLVFSIPYIQFHLHKEDHREKGNVVRTCQERGSRVRAKKNGRCISTSRERNGDQKIENQVERLGFMMGKRGRRFHLVKTLTVVSYC